MAWWARLLFNGSHWVFIDLRSLLFPLALSLSLSFGRFLTPFFLSPFTRNFMDKQRVFPLTSHWHWCQEYVAHWSIVLLRFELFADKLTAWKEFNGREEETILTLSTIALNKHVQTHTHTQRKKKNRSDKGAPGRLNDKSQASNRIGRNIKLQWNPSSQSKSLNLR